MDQYEYIRTAHRVYGKKIKQIARETGHSKNTIKRVLRGEYTGYKLRSQQPYPVLGPYLQTIDKWLEDDKNSPKKQRLKFPKKGSCRDAQQHGHERIDGGFARHWEKYTEIIIQLKMLLFDRSRDRICTREPRFLCNGAHRPLFPNHESVIARMGV